MTDFTGKLIANTYKDILTIAASVENSGIDSTLRRVQDGGGNNSPLKLSESAAAFTGNVSVNGNLTVNGSFQPDTVNTNELQATTVSATNITTNTLNAGTLTFQDVSVSTLRAGTVSATNINAGSTLTVDGDSVVTSAVAVSTAAILRAIIATTIANTSAALQSNIDVVSVGLSATNTQTQINATQIGLAQTSITANASAITVNSDAITSINSVIAGGAFASVGTSAALETRIAGVSSTMATSIANVSSALEARIAGVSTALASTSAALTSNINTVSATLSIANVSIAANSSAIAALQALTYASAGTSATLETRINSVSVLAETKASAATSANLETRIAAVSSTMATSIGNSNSAITALSATLATSIGNSNSAITALSATMATSIANHLPLAGGTLTGALTLNADPTADLNAATKQYVDNLTASGIHFHESVRVENPGALTVTYDNGTAGVGATLTNAGTQAALVIDGITMVVDDRVLIYEQTDATQNGVYVVTNIGSGSTNWVLTRSSDTDTSGNQDDSSLDEGSYFFVEEGNTGAGESYVCSTVGTITFGTTEIHFVQFSSSITYTAGSGIDINMSRVISTSGVPTNAELAAVSATMATSIANSNSAITALSATMATSIDNSNTNITTNAAAITSINGVLAGGLGTVTNIKAGSNISMTEAGTTVTETTTSATIAVTSSPSFSSAVITGDLTVDTNTLYVDSTNNRVGIGTSSPAKDVHIKTATTDNQLRLESSAGNLNVGNDSTGSFVESTGSRPFRSFVNGSERMRIDNSGNVGIGTSSPSATLGVNGRVTLGDQASSGTAGAGSMIVGAGALFIQASENQNSTTKAPIIFSNIGGSSESMRIDNSGNVGIGTTSPSATFEVESTDALLARFSGGSTTASTKYIQVVNTSDDTAGLNLIHHSDDHASVGNEANSYLSFLTNDTERARLETDGDLHVDGNVIAYSTTISDIRLKKDIAPIDNALWKVSQLNGCTFTYLKDNRESAGLIAQDLEKVLPSAVIEDKAVFHGEEGETYKTVQYDQVIGLLVEAVKELTAKVEELENASTK